jgi:hypothetical protein
MSAIATALLRLYPREWRRRYGAEMRELLADQRPSPRTIADLVAGAIDARINPQLRAGSEPAPQQGVASMMKSTICNPGGVSIQDQWRSAGWMLGGSLVLVLVGLLLRLQIGPNSFSEGLVYAAFPASLMLSGECTYFKRYSRAARLMMSAGGALLIIMMMWASVAVANRI